MTGSVALLADDLIWADRLARLVASAGATTRRSSTLDAFATDLAEVDAAVVDLTARAYDGIAAIALAHAAGRRVLGVGQHDDLELRKRALAAGAERVFAYRKLSDDGPATMAGWLRGPLGVTP